MKLIVDVRENKIISMLTNISFVTESIPCGDFLFEENGYRLLIERKSANDLVASIGDGRYREQRSRLLEWRTETHKFMYLIEGDPDDVCIRTLHRLMISYDIPVWRTVNIEKTVEWIQWVYAQGLSIFFKKRDLEQDRVESIRFSKNLHKKSVCTSKNILISMLQSINGVSYEMAVAIAAPYSSVHDMIISYERGEFLKSDISYSTSTNNMKKISPKTIQRVIEILIPSKETS